jgi:serine protein kinase
MSNLPDVHISRALLWEGTFGDYLGRVISHPRSVRSAFQRMHDMIISYGKEDYTYLRNQMVHYKIFDDPFHSDHRFAVYDLDTQLMKLVNVIRAGAYKYGQERRIILLHGPVGSAKSTLADLLGCGLEEYSKQPEGQTYRPCWEVDSNDGVGIDILGTIGEFEKNKLECPLHEEPLQILPPIIRREVLASLNQQILQVNPEETHLVEVDQQACPRCSDIFDKFMRVYDQDWKKILEKHLRVKRMIFSKDKRMGISSIRPKSEKDQDASELTGSTNFAALGKYGNEYDPRTFSFMGHFEAGNRGMIDCEEMLKASLGFLYDYLGASQERRIQPKNFMEVGIDELILGSTNQEEYERLKSKKEMAALRDRIIKIDIPYARRVSMETKVYLKYYDPKKRQGRHLAPGTIETAAWWAVLTRLKPPTLKISLRDKVKLYDGKIVSGFNEDTVRELQDESPNEGMDGISPRFINDRISNVFVSDEVTGCVNFFSLIREIEQALPSHQSVSSSDALDKYLALLREAQNELDEILKSHVRKAVSEEKSIRELYGHYIDEVFAYKHGNMITDPITKKDRKPDEEFMKNIENAGHITAHDEFREKLMSQMAKRGRDREKDSSLPPFDYSSDQRLAHALEMYLFDKERDKINWESTISRSVLDVRDKNSDKDQDQEKIDIMKKRLIDQFGYCDLCARDVLMYVSGIFKRGSATKK